MENAYCHFGGVDFIHWCIAPWGYTILLYSSVHTLFLRRDIFHFEIVILLFVLGALIQLFGCGCIIYITRKHLLRNLHRPLGNNIQAPNTQSDILRSYNKSQLQLVKVFGAIVTVSLSTALLLVVGGVFSTYARTTSETAINIYHTIATTFFFSKPVLYPIMESYMTHDICSVISKSCRSCFARIRSHRPCRRRDVITVSVSPGRAEAGIAYELAGLIKNSSHHTVL